MPKITKQRRKKRKIRKKSTRYRNSYKEEPNTKFRNVQFEWKSINYKDYIIERGISKYRVKWKSFYYDTQHLQAKDVQKFLNYWKNDIASYKPYHMGVKIKWKDSYIAKDDII